SKTSGFEASTQIILDETEIAEIDEMYAFQHDILYHIAYGKSDDNESLIAFVPKSIAKKDKEKEKDEKQEKNERNKEEDEERKEKDKINKIYVFQNNIIYYIAYGKSDDNESLIAFVPKSIAKKDKEKENDEKQEKNERNKADDEEMKDIITVKGSDMLSKENIEAKWKEECDQCTLKSSAPAMIDDTPLWELTYFDSNNRFVMEYRQLEDGDVYEQLKMNRKYN